MHFRGWMWNSLEAAVLEKHRILWTSLQRLSYLSVSWIGERSPPSSCREKGSVTKVKCTQNILSTAKACFIGENISPSLSRTPTFKTLSHIRGKTENNLCQWRNTCKDHSLETGWLNVSDLIMKLQNVSSQHLTTSAKGL